MFRKQKICTMFLATVFIIYTVFFGVFPQQSIVAYAEEYAEAVQVQKTPEMVKIKEQTGREDKSNNRGLYENNQTDEENQGKQLSLKSLTKTDTMVELVWTSEWNSITAKSYDIYRDNELVNSTTSSMYTDDQVVAETEYLYIVKAKDLNGEIIAVSNEISVTTNTKNDYTNIAEKSENIDIQGSTDETDKKESINECQNNIKNIENNKEKLVDTDNIDSENLNSSKNALDNIKIDEKIEETENKEELYENAKNSVEESDIATKSINTDEHGNSIDTAADIVLNSAISAKIDYKGDVDYFKFTASESGNYIFGTKGYTDTYGYLYDSNGKELLRDRDSGEYINFQINAALKAGQTYFVRVSHQHYKESGAYSIFVLLEHGNSIDNANNIVLNSEISAAINYERDVDYFKFTANKSDNYTFKTTGSTDVYGYLYDSSGTMLSRNDDDGEGRNFQIIGALKAGETYYIKVEYSRGWSTGEYSIIVDISDLEEPSTPTNFIKTYQSENRVSFSWTAATDNVGVEGYIIYRDFSVIGYTIATNDTYNISNLKPNIYKYTVRAYDKAENESFSSEPVFITIPDDHGNSKETATNIVLNTTISAKMDYKADADYFKFIANEDMAYSFETQGSKDTRGYLYDSSGNMLCYNDDGGTKRNFKITYTLTEGQTYYVKVCPPDSWGYSSPIGPYSIRVIIADEQEPSIPTNFIKTSQTKDSVSFSWIAATDNMGVAGYKIYKDNELVGDTTSTSYTSSLVDLKPGIYSYIVRAYDVAGNVSPDIDAIVITIPDDHGNSIDTATNIALDSKTSAEIDYTSDVDYFKFTVNQCSAYSLETEGSTDTFGCLYDSSGVELTNDNDGGIGSNFKITHILTSGQTYYLKVNHHENSKTGAYTIHINKIIDYERPSMPNNFMITSQTMESVSFSWSEATDNIGVKGYKVYRDWKEIGDTTTTSYTCSLVGRSAGNGYGVKAYDEAGNTSKSSNVVFASEDKHGNSIDTATSKVLNPTISTFYGRVNYAGDIDFFKFTANESTTCTCTFSALEAGFYGHLYDSSGNELAVNNDGGIECDFKIKYKLIAGQTYYVKASQEESQYSNDINSGYYSIYIKLQLDDEAPSSPSNLKIISQTEDEISLSWSESTDNIGVKGYKIYRNDELVGNTITTNYTCSLAGLEPGVYIYTVRAYDEAGNESLDSNAVAKDDHGDSIDSATNLNVNSQVPGNILYAGDVDYFKITADISGKYIIETTGLTDTQGFLYDNSGTQLAYNNDSTVSTNFLITYNLTAGQTYYVKICHCNSGGTGTYFIRVLPPININCIENDTKNIMFYVNNIQTFSTEKYILEYDANQLEVIDLCTLTKENELNIGDIGDTGITIVEYTPGKISFKVDKIIPDDKVWSGVINCVTFKSLITGNSEVTYRIEPK